MSEKVYCKGCCYLRPPHRPEPYSSALAGNPDVQQHWRKWEEDLEEVETSERDRFRLGQAFTYKPQFYSWCQYWTDLGRHGWQRNQFGGTIKVYELTARRNANHDCTGFKPGDVPLRGE